ncbi:thymidine phosphorylase, partial [Micrococcus sp. SIMBA_144]
DAESVGVAAMYLGAGRATKDDQINHGVGITLKKKVGDKVEKGEALVVLHSDEEDVQNSINKINEAYTVSKQATEKPQLIYKVIN